jgi:uncharacterized membrane protein
VWQRVKQFWSAVRASFWFLPSLLVLGSGMLAVLMVYLDQAYSFGLTESYPMIFAASADGARKILAALIGSMITVAGVIFSITIVALSLAANQYSPRILRNYMSDRPNQLVLGIFVGVFVYCLIVLRTIRGGQDEFVPSYSLSTGMLLALIAIGFLIFFIHHIARMVQASAILASIYRETVESIDAFENTNRELAGQSEDQFEPDKNEKPVLIRSPQTGYIQDIDLDDLIEWAEKREAVLEMARGIGDFVIKNEPLLKLYGTVSESDKTAGLVRAFSIATDRTIEQDPAFGIRQIVDIALKALSPGVNDSSTAATCIDYLGGIVFHLTEIDFPSERCCTRGKLRLIARRATFEHLLDLSFHEIRQNAAGNMMLYLRLMSLFSRIAGGRLSEAQQNALWKHVTLLAEAARARIEPQHDRTVFNVALADVASLLQRDYSQLAA